MSLTTLIFVLIVHASNFSAGYHDMIRTSKGATPLKTRPYVRTNTQQDRRIDILGGSAPDDDETDHDKTDTFKPWLPSPSTTDVLSLIHISGDKDLQHRLRTLCKEFKDIFSNELPAAPAKIPEFHLTVKVDEWKVARNRAPPRAQSPKK